MRSTLLLVGSCLTAAAASARWLRTNDWTAASLPVCTIMAFVAAVSLVRMGDVVFIPDVSGSVQRVRRLAEAHRLTLDALILHTYAGVGAAGALIVGKAALPPELPDWCDSMVSGLLGLLVAYVAVRSVQLHRAHASLHAAHRRMAPGS